MISEEPTKFIKGNEDELSEAFFSALSIALSSMNYDLRCVDWLSYNPDFFIEQENVKVA